VSARPDQATGAVTPGRRPWGAVRLGGWWVDGFGALRDREIDGLDPGLNVLAGPNEAGKTTQLAFLRYVLFGFPKRTTACRSTSPSRVAGTAAG
jgi:uncharacterized protein YhaN